MVSDTEALAIATFVGAFFYWVANDRKNLGFEWDDKNKTATLGLVVSVMMGLLFGVLGVVFFDSYFSDFTRNQLVIGGFLFGFIAPYLIVKFCEMGFEVLRYLTLPFFLLWIKTIGRKVKKKGGELTDAQLRKLTLKMEEQGVDPVLALGRKETSNSPTVQQQEQLAVYEFEKEQFKIDLYKDAQKKPVFDVNMAYEIIQKLPNVQVAQEEVDRLQQNVNVLAMQKHALESADVVVQHHVIIGLVEKVEGLSTEIDRLTSPRRKLAYRLAAGIGGAIAYALGYLGVAI